MVSVQDMAETMVTIRTVTVLPVHPVRPPMIWTISSHLGEHTEECEFLTCLMTLLPLPEDDNKEMRKVPQVVEKRRRRTNVTKTASYLDTGYLIERISCRIISAKDYLSRS